MSPQSILYMLIGIMAGGTLGFLFGQASLGILMGVGGGVVLSGIMNLFKEPAEQKEKSSNDMLDDDIVVEDLAHYELEESGKAPFNSVD